LLIIEWAIVVLKYPIEKILCYFSISVILSSVVQPSYATEVNIWKFGIGTYVILLFLLLSRGTKKTWITYFGLLVFVWISIYFGARSLAGFVVLAIILLVVYGRRLRLFPDTATKKSKGILIFLLASVTIIYFAYIKLAQASALGVSEGIRASKLIGSLGPLASRIEIFYSFPAFLQKPFTGYGSLSNVPTELTFSIASELRNLGISSISDFGVREIPVHSYIMQALVLSGILSLPFWLYVANQLYKALPNIFGRSRRDAYMFIVLFSVSWSIFFSPYANIERFLLPFTLTLMRMLNYGKT
jgi:hypothetical protein